ncbi:MAG: DUF3488 domain-containing protein [Gammaproteobacteria bacterium]|nr:DUF3488 domain-containing protein [Gammaproteobacteria bacterium]
MGSSRDEATTRLGRMGLLLSLLVVVSPHLLRLEWPLVLFVVAVFLWRLVVEFRGWPQPGRLIRLGLTAVAFALVITTYHTAFGRQPGVALLTLMLTLKLVELRAVRDGMLVIFIGFFLMITNFLFDQAIYVGGYLLVAVLVLITELIVLNHPQVTRQDLRQHLRFAGVMVVQALPLMLLLFILFPRISAPLWSLPRDEGAAKTGVSDRLSMGDITHLADSNEVAFRVDFEGEPPPAGELYWRVFVMSYSDGRNWRPLSLPHLERWHNPASEERADYTITLEPHQQQWLVALEMPLLLPQGLEQKVAMSADYQLQLQQPLKKRLRYRLIAGDVGVRELLPQELQAALQLPAAVNPRTRELGEGWAEAGLSGEALVRHALQLLVEEAFYYSRTPPPLGANAVDQFLFESRRGFCEHYAAAFVTVMRAAGLPARVVTGYQGGELNPVGEYLIVRQADAHAWAEVWLEGRGWTRVDPTAAIPPERVENPGDGSRFDSLAADPLPASGVVWLVRGWRQLSLNWDALNHQWNYWVVGFSRERQQQLLSRLGLDSGWQDLGIALALMVAVVMLSLTFILLRRRVRPDPLQQLFQRYRRWLQKKGVESSASETAEVIGRRAMAQLPRRRAVLQEITHLFYRLRYDPDAPSDLLPRLRQSLRQLARSR